ncbi:MAG: metal ABC transporter permease, partial [Solirubrobacterales bacterium]
PRKLEMLLLGMLALTVIVALQAVGIVLVVAMLITPGATAYLLTDRFSHMILIAAATGVLSTVLGTYLSFHVDASTGGSIVCVLALLFLAAYLFSPSQGVLVQWVKRQRRPVTSTDASVQADQADAGHSG